MIPNITRGGNTLGVLRYLLGKGRREEHQDPHLVAGSPEARLSAGGRLLELRDAGVLARFLDEPREVFGTAVQIAERDQNGRVVGSRQAHVWHCSLSLHPDEPDLDDARWAQITERFVQQLGFAGERASSAVPLGRGTPWSLGRRIRPCPPGRHAGRRGRQQGQRALRSPALAADLP